MTLLQRLQEKQAEGKKVISIDYVIHALCFETNCEPRTDVSESKTMYEESNTEKSHTTNPRPFQKHSVDGQPKPMSEYFTKVH